MSYFDAKMHKFDFGCGLQRFLEPLAGFKGLLLRKSKEGMRRGEKKVGEE